MSKEKVAENPNTSPSNRETYPTPLETVTSAEHALQQRVKELGCLYALTSLIGRQGVTIEAIMQGVVDLIPASLQYPEETCARIDMDDQSFMCERCSQGTPVTTQSRDIVADGEVVGKLTVGYLGGEPPADTGPFLREECELLDAIALHLGVAVQHRKAEKRVETLARFPDQNPNPVLRVSSDGTVLYHNEAGTPLLEHWRSEKGKPLPEEWRRLVSHALEDGKPRTAELSYGGKVVSLTFAPVVESLFANIYGLDVTERTRIEDRFRSITENAADYIFIKDADRRYTFVNPAMRELLALPEADILGKTPDDVFGPEQARTIREVDDRTFAGETVNVTRKLAVGDQFLFFNTIQTPLTFQDGRITAIMGIVRDVTQREQAERVERELRERLARVERMESLGVLAGGIAHDLNNLLGPNVALPPIILEDLGGVTREQCENIDEVRECVAAISESSSRAAETIKDMAVLSKSHVQTTAPLHINQAVTKYLKSHEFEEMRKSVPYVSFKADLDKSDPWIAGSRSHVDRLLSNLTRNAALAIKDKGVVTIKTWCVHVEDPIVAYEVIEPGSYVVLEISDTGTGIEPDALKRVFEPFFTTRKKTRHAGSGLGLSVVHGIVRSHGGSIDVTSEVERGTTFMLYLPATGKPSEQKDAQMDAVPTGTERILVVDDEPSQLFIARQGLERAGYSVVTAANGQEALALFEQAIQEKQESPFDLVVLDMVMEPGANGTTTYKNILELYPEQKAMIVSGYAGDEGAEEEARKLNADWLAKPYERGDLAHAVRKRLDTHP